MRGRLVTDPAGDLGDCGRLEASVGGLRYWRQECQPGERCGPRVRFPVCGWSKTGEAPPTTVQRPSL
jgi:hypothetical protein